MVPNAPGKLEVTAVDHVTDITATLGVTAPLWLHLVTPPLQVLFLSLSCAWLALQIYYKLFQKDK